MDNHDAQHPLDTESGPDGGPDTYNNFDRAARISSLARTLSWVCMGLFALLLVADGMLIGGAVGYPELGSYIRQTLVASILPIVLCVGGFVVLRAVSERLLYVLPDVEENTRDTSPPV
jgi:hypothetical protein